MGIDVDVTEAVKDALNAWSWSQEFTASRVLKSNQELEDIGTTLDVEVSFFGRVDPPQSRTGGQIGRGKRARYFSVDILVQQRVDSIDSTTYTDPLVNFTGEIADYFDGLSITVSGAQVKSTESPKVFTGDSEHFNAGVFSSLVRLVLEVIRDR